MNVFIKGGDTIPKLISNLREEILACGKRLLLQNGYKAFTIRAVASECGIAPGTMYNYFPSKDMLCAVIMLDDWNRCLEEGRRGAQNCDECIDGIEAVYQSISDFAQIYASVWAESGTYARGEYHAKLVESVRAIVRPLLERMGRLGEPDQSGFVSEILIQSAVRTDVCFENIKPFINKLI